MAITTTEIANYVGVSQPVVSKVLMGGRSNVRVSDATRQRIEAAAQELGFRPNAAARSMKRGSFNTVGYVVMGFEEDHVFSGSAGVAAGACKELAAHDKHMAYSYAHVDDMRNGQMPPVIAEAMVDALLLDRSGLTPEALVEAAERYHIPHVAINTKRQADCVYPDDFNGSYRATRELIELGHRRVGYVGCNGRSRSNLYQYHYSEGDRLNGYRQAMKEAGLTPQSLDEAHDDRLTMSPELVSFISSPETRPTAVLCYGPGQAINVAMITFQAGLRVPQDVSIVTMNRANNIAELGTVRFDSYHMNDQRMGKAAAQMVLEKCEAPKTLIKPRPIAFERIHGATVCPASSAND